MNPFGEIISREVAIEAQIILGRKINGAIRYLETLDKVDAAVTPRTEDLMEGLFAARTALWARTDNARVGVDDKHLRRTTK